MRDRNINKRRTNMTTTMKWAAIVFMFLATVMAILCFMTDNIV